MFNQVLLFGRVCAEPTIKNTNDGRVFCEMTMAVNRPFKNGETGEYETDFIKVTVWQGYAETAQQYCTKGSTIGVKGRIATRKLDLGEEKSMSILEVYADQIFFINLQDKAK